jgi:23S rRNA (cytosine1962-C5)-methyltransferase
MCPRSRSRSARDRSRSGSTSPDRRAAPTSISAACAAGCSHSYTGTLGLAARTAGARAVVNVDSSRAALDLAARHHGGGSDDVVADVFEWLPRLARGEEFQLVIADPPPMTSRIDQVAGALAAYRRLYRAAAPHVAPGGHIVACCCTSRIDARSFQTAVLAGLGAEFRLERRIPPEPDHPVGFAEADYLKVLVLYRGRS